MGVIGTILGGVIGYIPSLKRGLNHCYKMEYRFLEDNRVCNGIATKTTIMLSSFCQNLETVIGGHNTQTLRIKS